MRKTNEQDKAWAEALAKKRPPAVVFHEPTGLVGAVAGCELREPEAGDPLLVLRLEGGHELHALKENFQVLTVAEARLWKIAVEALSGAVGELAVYAAAVEKVERAAFTRLVAAALQAQARAVLAPARPG